MLRIFLLTFLLSVNLFAQDTLKIAVYDSPPFGMKTRSGNVGGLMVELWEDIAKDLNVNYTYELTNMNTLISGLQTKNYDIGLGAISITPGREQKVDFSHAVNPSGTGIAVSKKYYTVPFFEKWTPIFLDLLKLVGFLMLLLFASAVLIYWIEKRFSKEAPSERMIQTLSDGLWWSAVTMTTVGYGDKVPGSKIGKILGIVWIFFSIIFFSLFTAHASSKLDRSERGENIDLDELRYMKIVAVAKSSGAEFLDREEIDFTIAQNINEAIEKVLEGEFDAVVSNVPVLKYHNKTNFKNQLLISDTYLIRNNMGIALQEESFHKEQIDKVLLEKILQEKWQKAVYKYIGE